MSVKVVMPQVGESVESGFIASWLKNPGDSVDVDEPLVSVETDKATVDIPSPVAGTLTKIYFEVGAEVPIGAHLADVEAAEAGAKPKPAAEKPAEKPATKTEPAARDAAEKSDAQPPLSPAVRRVVTEKQLDPRQIEGTGPGGRILKGDALAVPSAAATPAPAKAPPAPAVSVPQFPPGDRSEKTTPMTPIRRRIAQRLVEAQQTAAILTTFNEVDMSRVMALRAQHQDAFVKKHGIKLGFMSFFVRASVGALRAFPSVNAEIRGNEIVYKNYADISVAIGGGKGLVVPVIRNAEQLSFADIEKVIADYGARARTNQLKLEEMQGGTFTVTNGGIYGSMMSTPIINPPQSGILGMHNIVKRAVVVEGDRIEARPMMYIALSYDHRLVDGREAVSFLVHIKDSIENPERMLFDL